MSDFLTRLAERTMGLVPVAKPIITPVFAPNVLNDNPPDSVWNNESQIANRAEPTPARESIMDFSKSDHADETCNESQIVDKAEPSRENLSAFSKSGYVDETRFPDTMTGQIDNSTFKPASKEVIPEKLSNYNPLREGTRGHKEPFADIISSEQNQRDNSEPEQSINAQQASPEVQHTKTYSLRSSVTERMRPSYVATPTSSSSMPPTIQVSIGRVEVKAITPPATQRSRTPSPTLSLDDYLKQRNRRQR
jgi:hypothetical protein